MVGAWPEEVQALDAQVVALQELESEMKRLVQAPANSRVELVERTLDQSQAHIAGRARFVELKVGSETAAETESRQVVESSKREFLNRLLDSISEIVARSAATVGGGFIFVDDFYQLKLDVQPHFLGFLWALVKDTPLALKVASVRYRTRTYDQGDPPIGMQVDSDILAVHLDNGLRDLDTSKNFLEAVLSPILGDHKLTLDEVFTAGARERMVLASGGVARDYIRVSAQSIRESQRRLIRKPGDTGRVTAVDVNLGAGQILTGKKNDLAKDSPESVALIDELIDEIRDFCLKNRKAYFLTNRSDRSLAANMDELQSFRFAHLLVSEVTLPNKSSDRYDLWLLDLSTINPERASRNFDFIGWQQRSNHRSRSLVFERAPGM